MDNGSTYSLRKTEDAMTIERNKSRKICVSSVVIMLSATLGISSCQKNARNFRSLETRQTDFQSLLKSGRGNQHNPSGPGSNMFFLAGSQDQTKISETFDQESGALSWVQFDTNLMRGRTRDSLDRECLQVVNAQSSALMTSSEDLARIRDELTELPNGQVIVSYVRQFEKIVVRDSYLDCIFSPDNEGLYRLREIVNRTGGQLTIANKDDVAPSFGQLLEEIGSESLELQDSRELIKRVERPDGVEYQKVHEFTAKDSTDGEMYTITLANGSKEIVEAYAHKVSVKKRELKANVYALGYRQATLDAVPLAFATVQGTGGTVQTDALGFVDLGDNDTSVTVTLTGQRASLFDIAASSTAPVSLTVPINADSITIPNTSPQFNAINAFNSIQKVNNFVRRQLAGNAAAILNQNIGVGINVAGACNAFFDPTNKQISLFAAGTTGGITCPNMATINDVIYHEWGHGLDDALGRQRGITDGAFSEGIGDIIASYMTNNPKIGQGFFQGTDTEIRTVDNTIRFPDGQGEVHDEGRIIGGTFWDLRVALIQRYGKEAGAYHAEKLFINHLLNSDAYRESYENVVRLDDNDGNPATRSPNFCLINSAFAKHGLATAEANCVDTLEGTEIKFSEDLKVGIAGATAKAVDVGKLMISSNKDTARVQICRGHWRTCVPADKTDIEFIPAGKAGDRLIFVSQEVYTPTEQQELTIIAKDAYGEIIGVKTVKITSR